MRRETASVEGGRLGFNKEAQEVRAAEYGKVLSRVTFSQFSP